MCSKRILQRGFTLVEMIVTIVTFGAMAAVGSLLISKLAPSYLTNVQAEQALSPREAALWRLSEDFRRSLVEGGGTIQAGCVLNLEVVSGVSGAYGEGVSTQTAVYEWFSDGRLMISAPWVGFESRLLLNNVTPSGSCPFTYISGIGSSGRSRLNVVFKYSAGVNEPVAIPVSMTMYSYANGPYVAFISPVTGAVSSTVPVSVEGFFPGMGLGILSSVTFMSGAVPVSSVLTGGTISAISANISSVSPAVVDVRVATPEGWSILKKAFTFQ